MGGVLREILDGIDDIMLLSLNSGLRTKSIVNADNNNITHGSNLAPVLNLDTSITEDTSASMAVDDARQIFLIFVCLGSDKIALHIMSVSTFDHEVGEVTFPHCW